MIPTADDLRSERARQQVPLYQLAARISLNPSRLSSYLNGRLPMPDDVALRIQQALRPETAGR
jgi:plasmid maintenance system antidote protein VapI